MGPNVGLAMGNVMAEGGTTDQQLKEFLTGASYSGGASRTQDPAPEESAQGPRGPRPRVIRQAGAIEPNRSPSRRTETAQRPRMPRP